MQIRGKCKPANKKPTNANNMNKFSNRLLSKKERNFSIKIWFSAQGRLLILSLLTNTQDLNVMNYVVCHWNHIWTLRKKNIRLTFFYLSKIVKFETPGPQKGKKYCRALDASFLLLNFEFFLINKQKQIKIECNLRILVILEDPITREPGMKSFPIPLFTWLFGGF